MCSVSEKVLCTFRIDRLMRTALTFNVIHVAGDQQGAEKNPADTLRFRCNSHCFSEMLAYHMHTGAPQKQKRGKKAKTSRF